MKNAQRENSRYLKFNSIDEVFRYVEEMAREWEPIGVPYRQGSRLVFHEYKFSLLRACAASEISKDTLESWRLAGLRLFPKGARLPRATDVARLCAVRDMVSLDVPLPSAAEIAERLSNSILFHALRSSASVTRVIQESETGRCRTIGSELGVDEACLRLFLKGHLARFALIDGQGNVHLQDEVDDGDHVAATVLDLEGLGTRLAEHSGGFLAQIIILQERGGQRDLAG